MAVEAAARGRAFLLVALLVLPLLPPATASLGAMPPRGPSPPTVVLASQRRGPFVERPVLDLAFMGADQLVVLFDGEVVLYRWSDGALAPRARQTVPSAVETVRHPGGRLRAVEAESAFWLLTSRNPKAALYTVEEGRLVPRDQADALPWPGSSTGLRYRPGTDWLLGSVEGLGSGPFLALTSAGDRVAVTPEGRLLGHGEAAEEDPRLGPTLAALWPGYVVASLAVPPGKPDALVVVGPLRLRPLPTAQFPLSGAVRALTSRLEGTGARVVAILEDDRGFSLLEMRLERAR